MKSQMSLKWKLTLSVFVALVIMCVLIAATFKAFFDRTDEQFFAAVKKGAFANAKAVAGEIAFELAAKLPEDTETKLRGISERTGGVHAIVILQANGAIFARVGEDVKIEPIRNAMGNFEKEGVDIVDDVVVAVTRIKADEASEEPSDSARAEGGGLIVYMESLKSYRDFQRKWIKTGIFGMGAILFCLSLMAFFLGHTTAKPINRLVAAAQRIADGDLENISVDMTGSAETNRLAVSIQAMAKALQSQVTAIKAITKDVSAVSREIASAMTHLASSAAEQAAAVTETASTVEEMEKAGKSAGGNAGQIVEAAEKTTEASIRGRNAVETTSEIILMIKDDSQDISEKSKNLLAAVEEVGNIISSVNGIAEQSKILAVNASIEAAKAGEYGSGFAVVAQEVKDLAQQSKDATLQITDTLTAIRQAIEKMVGTAQTGEQRTDEGVRMIANAGAIMNDLAEAIRENSDFANVIATNINQQTIGLTQIATAIEEINSTALENQDISRKIEHSTRSMTRSVDKLSELVGKWRTPEARSDELND
ncbi:MAG: methyl-accepting chemotaxis protein [Myxococcota bacterium]|jgi:methyl-accepting chemotaxis protein|nr:methyl-accepting chemotaxis protein [Myxococcota bacterium]